MNAIELTKKAEELATQLQAKREQMTTALVDGKDPGKLTDEIARIDNEVQTYQAAAKIAGEREAKQAEAARLAELKRQEAEADRLHAEGVKVAGKLLKKVLALTDEVKEYQALAQAEGAIVSKYGMYKTLLTTGEGADMAKNVGDMLQLVMRKMENDGAFNPDAVNPLMGLSNKDTLRKVRESLEVIRPTITVPTPAEKPAPKRRSLITYLPGR